MDKTSVSKPHYKAIYDILQGKIRSRYWKYGERLPTREALCKEFSVSLITIKTVMRNLQQNGYVHSIRGNGTFVCWKKEQEYYLSSSTFRKRNIEILHSLFSPTPAYSYIMNILADAFMEKNPQVSIRFMEVRPHGADDPYLQLLGTGKMPLCGEFFWHAMYAKLDALYPLDQLPDFDELKQELLPHAFYPTPGNRNKSHIYALYFYLGIPLFMILNSGLLEKVGLPLPLKHLTWPLLHKINRTFAGSRQFSVPYSAAVTKPFSYHGVKPFIELMGQDLFHRGNSLMDMESFLNIFNSESAHVGLEHIRRIIDEGNILFQKGNEYFALGDVGLLPFSSSWSLNLIEMLNPELQYHISPIPPVGKNKKYRSFYSGYCIGIFRNGIASDTQLQMAWEWLRFFFHRRSQYLFSQEFKLPVRCGSESYLQKKSPMLNILARNMLSDSIPQPDFIGMRPAFAIAGHQINRFLNGMLSVEQCLANIREDLMRQFF